MAQVYAVVVSAGLTFGFMWGTNAAILSDLYGLDAIGSLTGIFQVCTRVCHNYLGHNYLPLVMCHRHVSGTCHVTGGAPVGAVPVWR